MDNQAITTRQFKDVDIKEFTIISNDQSTREDKIPDMLTDLYYYESILNETIRTSIVLADIGNTVQKSGIKKTLLEGLPLVGQEKATVKLADANGIELKFDVYVNKITPMFQDTTKSLLGLDFVSKEGILNYKVALNTRFDGKISDSINKILTDTKYLNTQKKLDIEETENTYNFIGNQRRPFYTCVWLAKKAIPKIQNAKGNTAGYFFYETSDGFKFKSLDGLLSENDPGSGSKKKYKSLIYNQTSEGAGADIPAGYGKILEHNVDDVTGTAESKLQIGTYSTRTILFDPFNCYYEVITPNSKELEKNLQLAGKELPKLNPEFNREEKDKDFSRTQYMLIDKGALPTGNTSQQISKSKEQNFDPKNILNQSTMRYNQLFSTKTTITIIADFSLHAGDLIFIDSPELSSEKTQGLNKQFGGFYIIADLCHYINKSNGGWTKLTLVRDSLGKKGSPIPL